MRPARGWLSGFRLIAVLIALPLALWLVAAEQNSWRPRTLSSGPQPLHELAFSADGTQLWAGSGSGEGRLWRVRDCSLLKQVSARRPAAMDMGSAVRGRGRIVGDRVIALAPNERLAAVARAQDTRIFLVDVSNGEVVRVLRRTSKRTNTVHSLAFAPDNSALASGDAEGRVKLWRLR